MPPIPVVIAVEVVEEIIEGAVCATGVCPMLGFPEQPVLGIEILRVEFRRRSVRVSVSVSFIFEPRLRFRWNPGVVDFQPAQSAHSFSLVGNRCQLQHFQHSNSPFPSSEHVKRCWIRRSGSVKDASHFVIGQ